MKVIIAGSRDITSYKRIKIAIANSEFVISEVVSGNARGTDRLGERWARENNILCKRFPANWDKYNKQAGYLRNVKMADYADALIALWDGKSKGTKHMINIARRKNLLVYVCMVK